MYVTEYVIQVAKEVLWDPQRQRLPLDKCKPITVNLCRPNTDHPEEGYVIWVDHDGFPPKPPIYRIEIHEDGNLCYNIPVEAITTDPYDLKQLGKVSF